MPFNSVSIEGSFVDLKSQLVDARILQNQQEILLFPFRDKHDLCLEIVLQWRAYFNTRIQALQSCLLTSNNLAYKKFNFLKSLMISSSDTRDLLFSAVNALNSALRSERARLKQRYAAKYSALLHAFELNENFIAQSSTPKELFANVQAARKMISLFRTYAKVVQSEQKKIKSARRVLLARQLSVYFGKLCEILDVQVPDQYETSPVFDFLDQDDEEEQHDDSEEEKNALSLSMKSNLLSRPVPRQFMIADSPLATTQQPTHVRRIKRLPKSSVHIWTVKELNQIRAFYYRTDNNRWYVDNRPYSEKVEQIQAKDIAILATLYNLPLPKNVEHFLRISPHLICRTVGFILKFMHGRSQDLVIKREFFTMAR